MPNNKFREVREAMGLTVKDMAEKMEVTPGTLYNWESGKRPISVETAKRMSLITNCSASHLLGLETKRHNWLKPVTKDVLSLLHGYPIWNSGIGWCLVNNLRQALYKSDGREVNYQEITGPMYTIPPAFTVPAAAIEKMPLTLDEVMVSKRIWVEPISRDIELNQQLKGWYRAVHCGRLVENEFGSRFYLDTYLAKWIAFDAPDDLLILKDNK